MKNKPLIKILLFIFFLSLCVGWSPNRDFFTKENRPEFITFNSIIDNDIYGSNEREFLRAYPIDGYRQDPIIVNENGQYFIYVYFENSSADNLNLIAKNTKVGINIPHIVSKEIKVTADIVADNSIPNRITDDIKFRSDKNITIEYIPGSACLINNRFLIENKNSLAPSMGVGTSIGSKQLVRMLSSYGTQLTDDVLTKYGALVGYSELNGDVPPGLQYSGYVLIKVNVAFAEDLDLIKKRENFNMGIVIFISIVISIIVLLIYLKRKHKTKSNKVDLE